MEDSPAADSAPASPPTPGDVTQLVAPPAISMIVLTALSLLSRVIELVFEPLERLLVHLSREADVPIDTDSGAWGTFDVAQDVFGFAVSGVVLLGALMMLQQRSWPLSLAAAVLISVPCVGPCCPIGIPIGIWALVVLFRPEVRAALERNG